MVNRAGEDRDVELSLPCIFANSTFADLYHGRFMDGAICNEDDGLSWFARVSIEAGGIGAVVMTDGDPSVLEDILTTMASMTEVPLSSLDHTWMPMQQTMEDVSPDSIKDREFHVTDDIVLVPGGTLNFTVWGNTIECFDPMCPVDVQFPWETVPHRRHSSWVEVIHSFRKSQQLLPGARSVHRPQLDHRRPVCHLLNRLWLVAKRQSKLPETLGWDRGSCNLTATGRGL